MRVLITGGAGYLGTELAIHLDKNPEVTKIIIYDNLCRNNYNLFLHSGIRRGKAKFIKGELLDTRKLREILKDIDVVYHLAANVTTPFANESPHLFEQVNNWGTAELVYAVEESNVSRFIHLSSISVYGSSEEFVDINTIPNPSTFYGTSKLRGEKHVERLIPKLKTYILRCGNIYGYGVSMRFDAVINRFMFDACFLGKIHIHGTGTQNRSFIHVEKVANIANNLLLSDLDSGCYNLVDKSFSILEIADYIKELFPDVEMIFSNQHLHLRELKVKPDERILKLLTLPQTSTREEFEIFKKKFLDSSAFS